MKTIVKLNREHKQTVYDELDLPYIPEGAMVITPHKGYPGGKVIISYIDISPADGAVQTLVIR